MAEKFEITNVGNNRSRFQKLTAALAAIDQAMSYDPQEHRDVIAKTLWDKVAQLETRVNDLEGPEQRVA